MDSADPKPRRILLCEGSGDKAFFRHLIEERSLPKFEIIHPNPQKPEPAGRGGFAERLVALRVEPGFRQVSGILVVSDNDDDPEKSFRTVRNQVERAGYDAPPTALVPATGAGLPPLVIPMLPWSGEPGNLETLCLQSMYDRWPALAACVDEFRTCAVVQSCR